MGEKNLSPILFILSIPVDFIYANLVIAGH